MKITTYAVMLSVLLLTRPTPAVHELNTGGAGAGVGSIGTSGSLGGIGSIGVVGPIVLGGIGPKQTDRTRNDQNTTERRGKGPSGKTSPGITASGHPTNADGVKFGGSGRPMQHGDLLPSRSRAIDKAKEAGKGTPIVHDGHVHPATATGEKKPGQHYHFDSKSKKDGLKDRSHKKDASGTTRSMRDSFERISHGEAKGTDSRNYEARNANVG